jgi:hypothetical protein
MKRKRKTLLVYPHFQLGLILANVGLMAAALSFVGVQMRRSFSALKQMGQAAHIPEGHAYFKFLDWQTSQMYSYLAIAFVSAFVLSAIVTLLISNRMAGPIVRLRGYFKSIAENGAPNHPIEFRDGDFFSDLPQLINQGVERLTAEKKDQKKPKAA